MADNLAITLTGNLRFEEDNNEVWLTPPGWPGEERLSDIVQSAFEAEHDLTIYDGAVEIRVVLKMGG